MTAQSCNYESCPIYSRHYYDEYRLEKDRSCSMIDEKKKKTIC